jgi:hypothetical protein
MKVPPTGGRWLYDNATSELTKIDRMTVPQPTAVPEVPAEVVVETPPAIDPAAAEPPASAETETPDTGKKGK